MEAIACKSLIKDLI